ncbi:MAG: DegT/DnrJ/EryC1/StrS family aminotransferase [Candidatus Cloacimonadaceae bacterium]|nr:DegT/DnrJ/EryC1/StrS family aminotransferase [Candidatus Cloacimonadaceae bacterium]
MLKVPQFKSFVDKSDYVALEGVFDNNYIAEGQYAASFQEKLLGLMGAKHGCFASNGTLALYLAMRALKIGPGDEVIVQNTTFIASANAVEMVGATPIFVDILSFDDPSIDLSKINLSTRTKAIVIAHLFGTACSNIEDIVAYCNHHGLLLIEDAAQALSIKSSFGHCGTFGKVGTFSFYADKTITTGEGGFVVTNDENVYDYMLYLRNQGRKKSGTFIHPEIGYNFRITDIQAALGLSQFSKLDYIIQAKQDIYKKYHEMLGGRVQFLKLRSDFTHIPFRVVVFCDNAHAVMKTMSENGVEARTVFYPLHQQPCYEHLGYQDTAFAKSILSYERGICLPTWVGLTDEMIEKVAVTLLSCLA